MGGKKGKKKSKKKKSYTKAQKMAKARIAAKKTAPKATKTKSTPASTGRAPSKVKTKAQQMATARIAAGKTISQVKAANKQSMKDAASKRNDSFQAAKKAKAAAKKTTGIGPVKSGAQYAKSLSTATNQPTKKTTGIGPYADGDKYAAALKASPPRFPDGTKVAGNYTGSFSNRQLMPDGTYGFPKVGDVINTGGKSGKDFKYDGKSWNAVPVNTAMLPGDNMGSILGTGAALGFGLSLPGMIKNAVDFGGKLKENIERKVNPEGDQSSLGIGSLISAVNPVANLTNLGIAPAGAITMKSADSFGYPSQDAVDKAAGITASGLNLGGSGFTPSSSPSGGSTSRAISDGTSGVGPVADGGQYARNVLQARFPGASPNSPIFGMNAAQLNQPGGPFAQPGPTPENTPEADYTSYQPGSPYNLSNVNMNATNAGRAFRDVITSPFRALGINNQFTNKLIPKNDEAIQGGIDNRSQYNVANRPRPTLKRRGGGGGARLPVAPLTPEEILLPEQMAAAQAAPAYQQALPEQTGVDPNRLMQIQQQAYQQAFNPYNPLTVGGFNPFFRFFNRRGGARTGAFRKAFRVRKD